MPRRTKYQTAGKRLTGMRKFAVKKGVNYAWSPVHRSSSKSNAKEWSKQEKARRPKAGIRHRIVKEKGQYVIYQTHYP